MKNPVIRLLAACLTVSLVSGCSLYSINSGSLLGINVQDLEKARDNGLTKTVSLDYSAAFDKVTGILENKGLTIYQSDRKKQYIVTMGFPKQTDTTRVGIFFDRLPDGGTKITLSSLSSTALEKARTDIFGELD
ncbi:MAG: hypothetical protein ABIA77_01670 [Candidatus Omnitrophota bacterium]